MINMKTTTIYVIRHAEAEDNLANSESYEKEDDLTENGRTQAKEIAKKLENAGIVVVYSSPLLHAKRTAEIIAKHLHLDVSLKQDLEERKKGNLGGKPELEVKKEVKYLFGDPNTLSSEEMLLFKLFDDMESADECAERLKNCLLEIVQENEGKTIIAVSHGNLMRSFLVANRFATFKELPGGVVKNTGFMKLEIQGDIIQITDTWNIVKN